MTSTQVTPEPEKQGSGNQPMIAAADVHDVMREQLEYLIEHAQGGSCDCAYCLRYLRVRRLLLQTFD